MGERLDKNEGGMVSISLAVRASVFMCYCKVERVVEVEDKKQCTSVRYLSYYYWLVQLYFTKYFILLSTSATIRSRDLLH